MLNYKIIVRFIPASKVLYYSEHSLRVSYLAMAVLTAVLRLSGEFPQVLGHQGQQIEICLKINPL